MLDHHFLPFNLSFLNPASWTKPYLKFGVIGMAPGSAAGRSCQGRQKDRRKSAPGPKHGAESGGNSSAFHVLIFQQRDIPIPFIMIYFIGLSIRGIYWEHLLV